LGHEGHRADLQPVAGPHHLLADDLLAVEVGAVGAVEVLDGQVAGPLQAEDAVLAADLGGRDAHAAALLPADCGRRRTEANPLNLAAVLDNQAELHVPWASRAGEWAHSVTIPRRPRARNSLWRAAAAAG